MGILPPSESSPAEDRGNVASLVEQLEQAGWSIGDVPLRGEGGGLIWIVLGRCGSDLGVPAPSVRKPTVRTPLGRQFGRVGSPRGPEVEGGHDTLRIILAPMSDWVPCSPTSRRIVRNEIGSDPGGRHCAKYRV